jgi:hypothetical protein
MPQVIKKPISESLSFVRSGNEACNIEKLDRNRPSALNARPIIGLTKFRDVITGTCTRNLEISDCPLGVDGGKAEGGLVNT